MLTVVMRSQLNWNRLNQNIPNYSTNQSCIKFYREEVRYSKSVDMTDIDNRIDITDSCVL